jgi:hypothetical protein
MSQPFEVNPTTSGRFFSRFHLEMGTAEYAWVVKDIFRYMCTVLVCVRVLCILDCGPNVCRQWSSRDAHCTPRPWIDAHSYAITTSNMEDANCVCWVPLARPVHRTGGAVAWGSGSLRATAGGCNHAIRDHAFSICFLIYAGVVTQKKAELASI